VRRALLRLAGAAIALALLEAACRLHPSSPWLDPPVYAPAEADPGYALAPGAEYRGPFAGRDVRITVGEDGLRRHGPAGGTAERVHVLGDSMVFGWGLSDEETIPAQLARLVGPGVEVRNAGVPGWGPHAYATLLARLPRDETVVLLLTEGNDLDDAFDGRTAYDVRCGRLVVPGTWVAALPCGLLRSDASRAIVWASRWPSRRTRPLPLAFDEHATIAAGLLARRVDGLLDRERRLRGDRLLVGVLPWEGRYRPVRRDAYWPPSSLVRPHTDLPDALGLVARFDAEGDPARLYLAGDDHLSPDGAKLVATQVAAAWRLTWEARATASTGGGP
jgi:hypothetical protein